MLGKGGRRLGPLEGLARNRFLDGPFLISFSLPYVVTHSIACVFSLLHLNSPLTPPLSFLPALRVWSPLENEVRCSPFVIPVFELWLHSANSPGMSGKLCYEPKFEFFLRQFM